MVGAKRYPIPAAETRVEIRVSNSRFIATAMHTPTVEDAKAGIRRLRAEFADASHNVFAYVIGYGATTTLGMNDDGEPAGTAGRPALAVLRGSGIGDITVVVTRYFGGTLLGTGGLVRAYGDAVRAVLEALPRTERVERRSLVVSIPYSLYEQVKRLVDAHNGMIDEEDFAADVTLIIIFAIDDLQPFCDAVVELSAGQAVIVEGSSV